MDFKKIKKELDSFYFPKLVLKNKSNMPTKENLVKIVLLFKKVLFPSFFEKAGNEIKSLKEFKKRLISEIFNGLSYLNEKKGATIRAEEIAKSVMEELPNLKKLLIADVLAAYKGDPAATCETEVMITYPGFNAILHYRLAHLLYKLGAILIPRMISEIAHSETAIDIHPGAIIGEGFFIDHGTGVVIGETAIIGNNVTLYQGVTLGARNFQKDDTGAIIKGNKRHPVIEDNVVIYAGATILGRITVGSNSIIGGNVWITEEIPAKSTVLQAFSKHTVINGHSKGDKI